MVDPFDYDQGVQPENDLPEDDAPSPAGTRLKALALVLILVVPLVWLAVEIIANQLWVEWWQSIQPWIERGREAHF